MNFRHLNTFQIVPLLIGIGAAFFGFKLIKEVYIINNSQVSWLFVLAVFNWLSLIVLLVFLSLLLEASKKELGKLDVIIYLLSRGKKK